MTTDTSKPMPEATDSAYETPAEENQEPTTTVPLDMLAGAKEGDTVTLKVVSVDENEGVATVAMSDEGGEEQEPSGSAELASKIGQPA